jgi:hypothetical protein
MVWNTLYTSEYGYGTEHSVYIRVWLWYGTFCIHQSMVMVRVKQSRRWRSVFDALHVDVEYIVKVEIKLSVTKVHFVGPRYRKSLSYSLSTSPATRQPVQPPRQPAASEVAECNAGQRGFRALSDYSADA